MPTVTCETCGLEFYRIPGHIPLVKHHYCSHSCSWEGKKRPGKKKCLICNKPLGLNTTRETQYRTCSNSECRAKSRAGENNSAWKGGRPRQRRNYQGLGKWRDCVLRRDNFTCVKCGSKKNLEAHHIRSWKDYPAHRLRVSNGQTLCRICHDRVHRWRIKLRKIWNKL